MCGLVDDGTVACWGGCGDAKCTFGHFSPTRVPGVDHVVDIDGTYVLRDDGSVAQVTMQPDAADSLGP